MDFMNEFIKHLRPLLVDEELVEALTVLPEVKKDFKNKAERLSSVLDIYKIYIPNEDTINIYHRLYLSVLNSLEKKSTIEEVIKLNENYKVIKKIKRYGVIGGLDSFKVTGNAGVGKTSAIQRCIEIITNNKIIKVKNPYREIIPILEIETVSDCSIKNLLFSILMRVDEQLGTNFYQYNSSPNITTDVLLAAVANVLTNHVALLCIDEIERVVENKRGSTLINYLTQLINQSNVAICFVGTDASNNFFEMEEYLARRTIGISFKKMIYDEHFYSFCKALFRYQYTEYLVELNSELAHWLYNHSNGLPSMVVSLFVEAQRNAIISGKEKIDIDLLEKTFKENYFTMSAYIENKAIYHKSSKMDSANISIKSSCCANIFKTACQVAYKNADRAIDFLKDHIVIEYL